MGQKSHGSARTGLESGMTRRLAAMAWLALAGCAARQSPPGPAAASSLEGRTSVRVLQSHSPEPPAPTGAEITPAFASEQNELPEYPSFALRAGCQAGVVPIRVFVGPDGNVTRTGSIPGHPMADDLCHGAFWAATASAVRRWRFSPAYRQTPAPGPDVDGDGAPDFSRWEHEPVTIYLDFEFTFRVVGGRGQVFAR